jgi:hypothetical protein
MPRKTEAIQLMGTDAVGLDYAVQHPRRIFYLTYQGRLCQVRKDFKPMNMGFKYIRCAWSSEATTRAQVKKMNRLFATDQFGYVELTNVDEVLHNHLIK